ncbi:RING-H2 finger protein [Actinidia chinensis var. chinensis]|uniref:RING-type E3 ubiquitin transferase n=1 Tax=Actinidia chinensis var. chinensis TaxID=1590841 RepID=A0A2R6PT53_ACTCC|nr:RING-H2 finger protein [Actinidia chinensis var. chinensis]
MGDSSELNRTLHDSATIGLTGKVMVVAIVVLFFVVVFILFLHLYAKRFWHLREDDDESATTRRRRFEFAPSAATAALRRGLDPSVLKSLPTISFNPQDFTDGLECAVCLCDLADDEMARILPKCNHGFHVDCIDIWFQSHSTCPICRNPVSIQSLTTPESTDIPPRTENSSIGVLFTESMNFPTNVLFWGNQNQVSTLNSSLEEDHRRDPDSSQSPSCSSSSSSPANGIRGDGMLVIDVPNQIAEDEEQKSPMTTRLRSLKRLLTRDRKASPRSPSVVDAEQVGRDQN